jgi:hypothetical protein
LGFRRRADDRGAGVLLKTLCEQAHSPETFDENLTKAEASKLIDEMRQKAGVAR